MVILFLPSFPQATSLRCPFLLLLHSTSLPLAILHFSISLSRARPLKWSITPSLRTHSPKLVYVPPGRKEGRIHCGLLGRPTDRTFARSPSKSAEMAETLLVVLPTRRVGGRRQSTQVKFEMASSLSRLLSLKILISLHLKCLNRA